MILQGPPLGFDIMYLALADKNVQVRFVAFVDLDLSKNMSNIIILITN